MLFRKHNVLFATLHVVGSNNNLDPWSGIDSTDSFQNPRPDRLAEFERRQAATLAWLDEVFEAAEGTEGVFLMIQRSSGVFSVEQKIVTPI